MSLIAVCAVITVLMIAVTIGVMIGNKNDCYPGCIFPLVLGLVAVWMMPPGCERQAIQNRIELETVDVTTVTVGVIELRGLSQHAVNREANRRGKAGWVVISTCREGIRTVINDLRYIVTMRLEQPQSQP